MLVLVEPRGSGRIRIAKEKLAIRPVTEESRRDSTVFVHNGGKFFFSDCWIDKAFIEDDAIIFGLVGNASSQKLTADVNRNNREGGFAVHLAQGKAFAPFHGQGRHLVPKAMKVAFGQKHSQIGEKAFKGAPLRILVVSP